MFPDRFLVFAGILSLMVHFGKGESYAQNTRSLWLKYDKLQSALTTARRPYDVLAYAGECSTFVVSARDSYERGEIKSGEETSGLVAAALFVTAKVYNARLAIGDTTGALRFLGLSLPLIVGLHSDVTASRKLTTEFIALAIKHDLDRTSCERLLKTKLEMLRRDKQGVSDLINLLEEWFGFLSTGNCAALVRWFHIATAKTAEGVESREYQNLQAHVFNKMLQLARARFRNHDTESALRLYECMLGLAPDTSVAVGLCLEAGTRFAQYSKTWPEAYRWLEKTFRLSLELGDSARAKTALKDAFVVALNAKDWEEASDIGARYLGFVGKRLQDEEGKVLTNALLVWLRRSNYSRVDSCYPLVLSWAKSSADSQTIASLTDVAVHYATATGRFERTTEWLQNLLNSKAAQHNSKLQIAILLERVELLLQRNRTLEAQTLVDGLLATQRNLKESERARLYLAKGNINFQLGRLQTAVNAYEAALSMSVRDPSVRSAIVSNFAYVLGLLGQYEHALELCRETLREPEIASSPRRVLDLLSAEAIVYSLKGKAEIAKKLQEKCLELSLDVGDSSAYVQSLLNLAASSQRTARNRQADSLYSRIARMALNLGDVQTAAIALLNRAVVNMTMGKFANSDSLFAIAMSYIDELAPDLKWRVFYELALLRRSQGRSNEAVRLLKKAVAIVESLGFPLSKEEYKLGFVSQRYQVYAELVGALVRQAREDSSSVYEAFAIAEHSKARVLVELFGRTWPELAESFVFDESGRSQVLEGQGLVSSLAQQLPSNTWFVEFVVAPSTSYAFVLSPNGSHLRVVTIPVTENWLARYVRLLYQLSAVPVDNTEENALQYFRVASSLHQTLFSKVLPEKAKKNGRVLVIPDGVLFYLPFDVLCTRTDDVILDFSKLPYVVKDWDFIYAPSARAYLVLKERMRAADSCLVSVFADPDFGHSRREGSSATKQIGKFGEDNGGEWQPLPYTALEAKLITAAAGNKRVRSFTGRDACEARFRQEATQLRPTILHVASHGIVDNKTPKRSGILLGRCSPSDDGFVSVGELSSLRITSSLTVLSCCQTALGKLYRGEGVDGLARAFLLAGSKAVLVTLWSIADKPSAEFMGRFYEEMFQERRDPLDSLAKAKRGWLKVGAYSHPFFWAAFQLIGFVPARGICR